MIEVTNKQRGPLSIMVRSTRAPKAFTTLVVPGVGKGHNKVLLEDEKYTKWLDWAADQKLIGLRKNIPDNGYVADRASSK